MSQDNESPIDPMPEPESDPTPDGLASIERQLKKVRPRPVELDSFELERMARATPLRSEVEKTPSRRRRYRPAALVAGSWACGVLVGALVMFAAMRQGVAEIDSPTATARGEQDNSLPVKRVQTAEPSESHSDEPVVGGGQWSELESAVLALSVRDGLPAYGRGGPSYRAGMYLPRFAGDSPELLISADGTSADVPRVPLRNSPEAGPHPASSPDITPEQLMRDLLESSDFVL